MPIYKTVPELMDAYRHRKVHVLVRGLQPTEKQRVFAKTLVERRCPALSDSARAELSGMVDEMNKEWITRVIGTMMEHPKKEAPRCWLCSAREAVTEIAQ